MHVDGKGKAGFVNGIAHVELHESGGGTLMKYRADLQVGGRVASVGQRLLDSVGRAMSKQGLEAVSRSLAERMAPAAAAGAAVVATSPASPPAKRRARLRLYLVIAILLALALVALL